MVSTSDMEMNGAQQTPYEILLGEVDAVLAEWRTLVRGSSVSDLPPARLMDSLPEILPKLIRLAGSGAMHVDDELRDRIAHEHGVPRRSDAVPVASLTEEWDAVKRACARVLARGRVESRGLEEAQHRLDALIDDAIGYTLRGYYRDELDSLRGRGLERRDALTNDRRQGGDRRERTDGAR